MHETAVAVVGAGDADGAVADAAEAVGRGLGAAGVLLVCGGLGGVMAAACRGARAAGGTTLGLLPGEDRRAGNAWLDIAVPTGLGDGRNLLVVRAADAVIAVGGGWGTLSEVALAHVLGRPVIGLRTWTGTSPAGTDLGPLTHAAATPEEAVTLALCLARRSA